LAAIQQFQGVVFTSVGHWGALVVNRPAPNWVLNQCDADVEFWRVYAMQSTHSIVRLAARINYKLAHKHFSRIYSHVGRIIAVCEEDRGHTLSLSPQSKVDVIENGIDCSHYLPYRENRLGPPRLLFTGTSAARNIMALRIFVREVLPLIQVKIPDVELVIGGNFSIASQSEFSNMQNIRFTGKVDDMRPYFNQSDVFISPFQETHGSKLKVAEAMAMAMPIVSTPQGVRGFALVDGESVMIARNANEFADHCIALLRQPERRWMLGQAAREVALATIDWKILGKRLNQIVGETLRDINKDRPEKTSVSE
jgi:glycosyltransferase involved in cell wall biosynthesis